MFIVHVSHPQIEWNVGERCLFILMTNLTMQTVSKAKLTHFHSVPLNNVKLRLHQSILKLCREKI